MSKKPELKEVNPKSSIKISGKIYSLKKLTLNVICIFEEREKGMALQDLLAQKPFSTMSEIIYILLDDKTDFPTLESFREAIDMEDISGFANAMQDLQEKAMPVPKEEDSEKKTEKKQ